MTDSKIKQAIDCTRRSITQDGYGVSPSRADEFHKYISRIAGEELSIDHHHHRVTQHTIIQSVKEIIFELAARLDDDSNINLRNEFESLKNEMCKEMLGSGLTRYTIAFPLNIIGMGEPGDTFHTPDGDVTKISRHEWEKNYEDPARENESLERFLYRESPNELGPDKFNNNKFTFWEVEYFARDPEYAIYAAQSIIQLFISKLNFVHYRRSRAPTQPSGNSPYYQRWSPLRQPFIYIVLDDQNHIRYQIGDFEYRRRPLRAHEDMSEYENWLDELPDLNAVNHDGDDNTQIDNDLINALLAYQDGLTRSSPQQSFFSFWRGLENLTHVERGQPRQQVSKRAIGLFKLEATDHYVPWHQQEKLDELYDKRNDIAHDGPHTRIRESHKIITKRILDVLLQFHFEHYTEFNKEEMRTLLKICCNSMEDCMSQIDENLRENQLIKYLSFREVVNKSETLFSD
ncbi:hypothetical protein [Halorubrum sp. AS12]|uniref:hypothetical protein n=1 Tax=Halorubrum sp. AS12 TaxID=3409687 RepID=UPI003DA6FF7C